MTAGEVVGKGGAGDESAECGGGGWLLGGRGGGRGGEESCGGGGPGGDGGEAGEQRGGLAGSRCGLGGGRGGASGGRSGSCLAWGAATASLLGGRFTHVTDEAGPVADAASDFDALENLRLAYSDRVKEPQQLEMWAEAPP